MPRADFNSFHQIPMSDSAVSYSNSSIPTPAPGGDAISRSTGSTRAKTLGSLLMLLLFIGSGCAALIYEVVWLQLLQLNLGSSAVSVGVLLAVYMGGMCLGGILLPRRISP